jgi:hypothetical protein
MFNFVVALSAMVSPCEGYIGSNCANTTLAQVSEKESGVRSAMSTMGMMDSAHWVGLQFFPMTLSVHHAPPLQIIFQVSWIIPELILGTIHAGLMTAAAAAFQFQIVFGNSFALFLLLLFLANTALVAMGFCISTFITR